MLEIEEEITEEENDVMIVELPEENTATSAASKPEKRKIPSPKLRLPLLKIKE